MNDNNDIDDYYDRLAAAAPPLTDETIARLALVLRPVRDEREVVA